MRVRTFLGILLALFVVVTVAYIYNQNAALLGGPFVLTPARSVPLYMALLAVFLLGFLPAVSVLLTQTLKRDLARRRERRRHREDRSLEGSFRRATDYGSDGQWGRAAAELEALLADRPEDFSTLLLYGEVLRQLGRTTEALEVHRRASVLYPRSTAVLQQMAEDYEASGELEVAEQIRDRIVRDFPGLGLQALRRRRNLALGRKDWREAGRLQDRIETLLAESGDEVAAERESGIRKGLDYQRAVDFLESERVDDAERIFTAILERDPGFIPAAIMQGEAKLLRGDDDQALQIWRRGFADTGSPVFLRRIEDHFIELGQPMLGIETLHGVIAEAEDELLPRFYLGRFYYRLEMHDEALKVLSPLRDRIRSSSTYRYLLARIHERRGEMRRAVEALFRWAEESGLATTEFGCRICGARHGEWYGRCDACGSWNSIELEFELEGAGADEVDGRRSRPVEVYHGQFTRPDTDS